jgi:hypothetical protein
MTTPTQPPKSRPPRVRRSATKAVGRWVVRWSGRTIVVLSTFLFLTTAALCARSFFRAGECSYQAVGSGDLTLNWSSGRVTLTAFGVEDTRWADVYRLTLYSPSSVIDPTATDEDADRVLGVGWRINSWSPPSGVMSIPLVYPLVLFAAAPALWIAQRRLRDKRSLPTTHDIGTAIRILGPVACVVAFQLLALSVYLEAPRWELSSSDGWAIGRTWHDQLVLYQEFTSGQSPEGLSATFSLSPGSGKWDFDAAAISSMGAPPPRPVFSWIGFELYSFRDARAILVPIWPAFIVLAIWPLLALRSLWKFLRRPLSQRSFPVQ